MKYELEFVVSALKEWKRLDSNTREQFRKKLEERCDHPRVPSAKLRGSKDRYKIKLKSVGYRLVYEVEDDRLVELMP
jgi:mRNA interferase RelE/StbE